MNLCHITLPLLPLLRDWVILQHFPVFFFQILAFTLPASPPIRQGQIQTTGPCWTFWAACQRAPMFKEPGGADWRHPAGMSRGSMRKSLSSCDCWCGQCTLKLQCQQNALLSTPSFPSPNMFLGQLQSCWSNHEGKRSSWRCHLCLHVVALLIFTLIISAVQHVSLCGTPSQLHPNPPTLTDDLNTPALTRCTMQACYSRRSRIRCMLPLARLLWNVKGELPVPLCVFTGFQQ